ncbi:hypothetical protein GF354_04325, partial [Candidatus Peregrinibacteria bacterium]|nr:hypothetical protein [Candidatus Peregrinibacteria bacterium]
MKKFVFGSTLILLVFSFFTCVAFAKTPVYIVSLDENSQSTFVDIKPGDKFTGSLNLELVTDKEVKFQVNFSSSFGNVLALGGGGSVLDMRTWFTFPEGEYFTIDGTPEGKQSLTVPYEIVIPESIMPADYSGILSIGIVDETKLDKAEGAGIVFSTAIGIPFKFSVAGERVPKLVFKDFWLYDYAERYADTGLTYDLLLGYKFFNAGNAALKLGSDVVITNIFGEEIYNDNIDLGEIYPGGEESKIISFDDVGKFYGWINVNSDIYYNLFDLEGNIIGEKVKLANAFLRVYSIPWFELSVVFLVLIALFIYFFYRFYKRKALLAGSKVYVAKKTDTLQSICNKF